MSERPVRFVATIGIIVAFCAFPALADKQKKESGDTAKPSESEKVKATDAQDAGKDDIKKKAFKHPEGQDPPKVGEVGYVRRAKIDLMSAAAGGSMVAALEGGAKVTSQEESGDTLKVSTEAGQSGYVKKEDLRTKAPVEWKSNRKDITYQECLGKDCKGKKAKEVDKNDVMLEVDRGGPDNAFLYLKMPGGVWGWVPVAYMMEWKHEFK